MRLRLTEKCLAGSSSKGFQKKCFHDRLNSTAQKFCNFRRPVFIASDGFFVDGNRSGLETGLILIVKTRLPFFGRSDLCGRNFFNRRGDFWFAILMGRRAFAFDQLFIEILHPDIEFTDSLCLARSEEHTSELQSH